MTADIILYNGRIATMNPNQPWATALAIRDGRILAVGDQEAVEMKALSDSNTKRLDLNGRAATPGLVDSHVHFHYFALTLREVDVYEVPSLAEAQRRVATKAGQLPDGEWIQGRGWKNELWDDRSFPTAADLDSVAPDHPILLPDKSGHAAWANSLALQISGITAETPDPEGGEIQRDANGNPTGILFETAIELIRRHIPPITIDQLADAMIDAQQACWQLGLTGVHDFDGPDCLQALQKLHRSGQLGLRIYKNIPAAYLDHAVALGLQTDFGDEWLRIGGVKIFADGALGPQTALMIEPYANNPENYGIGVVDKEEMHAIASKASANQLSVTIHAIGDKAVHDVLDVYEAVRQEEAARSQTTKLRHRIEHVQIFHPSDRNRLAELGVIASMQPKHATSDMEMADRYWGERAKYSYAQRDMLNSGALVVFGSDSPVEPIDPMLGIHSAVTRKRAGNSSYAPQGWYPEQCFTLEEAIRAFTLAGAETSGQADRLGSLEVGKLADITIFDTDIFSIDPDELHGVKIASTIVGGEVKYQRSS